MAALVVDVACPVMPVMVDQTAPVASVYALLPQYMRAPVAVLDVTSGAGGLGDGGDGKVTWPPDDTTGAGDGEAAGIGLAPLAGCTTKPPIVGLSTVDVKIMSSWPLATLTVNVMFQAASLPTASQRSRLETTGTPLTVTLQTRVPLVALRSTVPCAEF
jgi:hypothetical protein